MPVEVASPLSSRLVGLMPLGALYPSKSGLMNKHIVKHIPLHIPSKIAKRFAPWPLPHALMPRYTYVIQVANTRIITGVSKTGLFKTWRDIMAQGGLRALYTGIFANFVLCANPAIKHMIYDQGEVQIPVFQGFHS